MKKRTLIVLLCIASLFASAHAAATCSVVTTKPEVEADDSAAENIVEEENGFQIAINGQMTEYVSVVRGDIHYVPLRPVFEKAGARVYFRSRDGQILILTRDGDVIRHVVGNNTISVNGKVKRFQNPTVSENYTTYMPMDMMIVAFRTNAVSIENQQITVQALIPNTDYGKAVNDTLYAGMYSNFNPEKFQRYIDYHIKNPSYSMHGVIFTVNIGLDIPFYETVSVVANPHDPLVLVNKYNRLPSDFRPNNLVSMNPHYTARDGKQYLMEKNAYESFVRMADAARKEGVSIRAISTYRTEDYQKRLYDKKVRATGFHNAENYSARPGFSEHQTGLAVDINSTRASFEKTNVFKWLQAHAHEYGYIMRYPKGQRWITGYEYEPWHYRYVGVEVATVIKHEGLNYEQYCAKYRLFNEFK